MTDLQELQRAHDYEMGAESRTDRQWSRWYKSAAMSCESNGWDTDVTRGLDGCEWEDGFSIDSAYDAFEAGWSVQRYIAKTVENRKALGL